MKDPYYLIRIPGPIGINFYLAMEPGGKLRGVDQLCSDVLTFKTYDEAEQLCKKKGVAGPYEIMTAMDLAAESTHMQDKKVEPLASTAYYIINQGDFKLHFSIIRNKYYWSDKPNLFCLWFDQESAERSLAYFKDKFKFMQLRIEPLEPTVT